MPLMKAIIAAGLALTIAAACSQEDIPVLIEPANNGVAQAEKVIISARTEDGVNIYGEPWFGDMGNEAPLVLLFHQGGSNGRGEYKPLQEWLNAAGFRAIAWDQRSGGGRYGSVNRTVKALPAGTPDGYCDTYADLEAALKAVKDRNFARSVIVWGSSYSASLVFQLAANHPDTIDGVIGFSPAAGGPLVNCRARQWADAVTAPMLALRPASEMANPSTIEQRKILEEKGVEFHVIENGVHGSSMLVDTRTKHDMSATRAQILAWLNNTKS